MTKSSVGPHALVVDANLAVRAVLPMLAQSVFVADLFTAWYARNLRLVAPDLWLPEATSAIRKLAYKKEITEGEAAAAVVDLFKLGLQAIPSDSDLCRNALLWAGRLRHAKAYDSFYIALAEREQTQLWTLDQKLARSARQAGIEWVHHSSEFNLA